ncbi:GMC family oxidoreductase N-terminal domain-containing protein [Streptomyces sp. NBC_01622]|uniref:GMC family oxidoreductase n=1 Tax=Streptomyces sp. NBC_01622 TaxID=2975903 RepID=UPI003864082D|nr:GMC family oxidoreductase N-terminal domain-containing protein [Streptomyces sp. NBC_01622]
MLVDGNQITPGDLPETFDYIVIGAGSAGSAVAARLLEHDDVRVLLLEAGDAVDGDDVVTTPTRWVENLGSRKDWQYQYDAEPHLDGRTLPLPQGRALGGSSSINGLIWMRGDRAVYDEWAAEGNTGWDYESVLPLFRRSEDWEDGPSPLHGTGGPIRVERARDLHPVAAGLIDAACALDLPYLDDLNVPSPSGAGPLTLNVRDGRRVSSWTGYLQDKADDERLTVVTAARVRKLVMVSERCVGVDVVIAGRSWSPRAAREVLVSAGAIGSPALLLRSGIGPVRQLEHAGIGIVADLPGVGKNLQDHPIVAGLCLAPGRTLPPPNSNLEGAGVLWRSRSDRPTADVMILAVQIPYFSREIGDQYDVPPDAVTLLPCLMRPASRGSVEVASAEGPVRIRANMLAETADLDALVAGVDLAQDLAATKEFSVVAGSWAVPTHPMTRREIEVFVRRATMPYVHPVGTCAMGVGEDAVVDSNLRVRGIAGLRVADSSVMPSITSGNTNAPSTMIGEFAAARIGEQ